MINDLEAAKNAGRSDQELAVARDFQRKAQFYLDFIESENSMGFHAPAEAVRILGESMNFSRQGQLALFGKVPEPRPTPASRTIARAFTFDIGKTSRNADRGTLRFTGIILRKSSIT